MVEDRVEVIREPVCFTCANFIYWPYCVAFPGDAGIPKEVRDGENDHTKPIEGDHGIMYKRKGNAK